MKTKTLKIQRALALSTLVFSALFITLNMNACGDKDKKGGGAAAPPGTAVNPNCPTCVPQGASNLGAALGQNSRISVGLSFSSGTTVPQGGNYSGTVTATGFLHIKTPFACNFNVGLPSGIFGASTVQPGTWMGAWGSSMVQGLVMQANGIQFVIGPGGSYTDGIINGVSPYRSGPNGEQYPSYLAGDVYIQSVNGQPCNVYPIIESIN